MWERTIRRTQLPLAYKQGFNPQPHMQFAAPLGVGFSGSREKMDFRLETPLAEPEVAERLSRALPPGVSIIELRTVALKSTPLQATLLGADYTLLIQTPVLHDGEKRVQDFLARREIWRRRQRKGREYSYNLRPVIHELAFTGPSENGAGVAFELRVQMLNGATGRPDEVLAELGLTGFPHLLHRNRLYFSSEPADAAVFLPYKLARQEDVASAEDTNSRSQSKGRSKKGRKRHSNSSAQPQVFGEKAADEFR